MVETKDITSLGIKSYSGRIVYRKDLSKITPKEGVYDRDNPRLTQALYKLITGQRLSESEKQTIRDSFHAPDDGSDIITELQNALAISGNNFNDRQDAYIPLETDSEDVKKEKAAVKRADQFDRAPLAETDSPEDLALKRMNLADELSRVRGVLDNIFGKGSEIAEKVKAVRDQLKASFTEGTDGFTSASNQALETELRHRLNRTSENDKSETEFAELDNEEFWLLYSGAVAAPSAMASKLLKKQSTTDQAFDFSNIPSSEHNAQEWHAFITGAQDTLPANKQDEPRTLLAHLQNLEEIDNPEVFQEMLKTTDYVYDESVAEAQMDKFNSLIRNLRAKAKNKTINLADYDYDPKLQATLEAVSIQPNIAAHDDITKRSLSRALYTLENPLADFQEGNTDIAEAIEVFGLKGQDWDKLSKKGKRNLLTALLREAKKTARSEQTMAAGMDPETTDPSVMFDRFKTSINYLHDLIHKSGRSDEGKRNLEAEMVRFMRSGELGDLAEVFSDTEAREALNYFSRGIGDSRFNVGLVKSLFNEAKGEFNIVDAVNASDNFQDVATAIQITASTVQKNGNQANMPEELWDTGASTMSYFAYNPKALAPIVSKDKDGNITRTANLGLIRELGLQAYFTPGEAGKKLALPAKGSTSLPPDFPEALKDLVRSAFQGLEAGNTEFTDQQIIEVLRSPEIVKDPEAEEVEFLNGGAPLMAAIQKALITKEENYQNYKSYDPDSKHTYSQLIAGRDKAIKFLKKYGVYRASPVTPAHHFQDYVDMVEGFASDLNYLEAHSRAHIDTEEEKEGSQFAASDRTSQPEAARPASSTQQPPTRTVADSSLDREMRQSYPDMFASFDRIMGLISADDFGSFANPNSKDPARTLIEELLGYDPIGDRRSEEQRRQAAFFNPFGGRLS
ncbi:MAG: hypothetical protein OXU45_02605 [Candidatus Melainabacteria bacterium]|nr:hypothetical protein [Candidatus Melainabacteria bacterium]